MKTQDYRTLILLVFLTLVSTEAIASESPPKVVIDTLLLEAVGEGKAGMIAVAEVIRNRALKRKISEEAVCLQRKQFSAWNDRQEASRRLSRMSEASRSLAIEAWHTARMSDSVRGADHYANLSLCSPSWVRKLTRVVRIGQHTFYK